VKETSSFYVISRSKNGPQVAADGSLSTAHRPQQRKYGSLSAAHRGQHRKNGSLSAEHRRQHRKNGFYYDLLRINNHFSFILWFPKPIICNIQTS